MPPLGLLYISSAIKQVYPNQYEIKILDSGTGDFNLENLRHYLKQFKPNFVGMSTLSCEVDLMQNIALVCKSIIKDCKIIVGGPHASAASYSLLYDQNIDIAVIGEGENTFVELLKSFEGHTPLESINGIAFRKNNASVTTNPRDFIESMDEIAFPSWDLINLKDYLNYPNWNGISKEKFYFPILTSRGCPYQCTYCHNIFGKRIRMRSSENVIHEIEMLLNRYGIKEFHVIDDAFNYDMGRAKRLCSSIINSGLKISLAFPNGLRADKLDNELIKLLKKSGAYKINFGFETVKPRLQALIKKNLEIEDARSAIQKVSKAGIITGGYFMFGLPTETRDDIIQTIDFAAKSELDAAYFFKVTPYPGSELYDYINSYQNLKSADSFRDLHFYSVERSYSKISPEELNDLLLFAQQKFYLNGKRLIRGLFKSLNKMLFFRNIFNVMGIIIQSYILRKLGKYHSSL